MSRHSLRCLALAGKKEEGPLRSYDGPHHSAHALLANVDKYEAIERDLCLFGFCGIKDPARPEVVDSIQLCKKAGIRVFMITGDNKLTAESIARDVGILKPGEESEASFEGLFSSLESGSFGSCLDMEAACSLVRSRCTRRS